MSAEPFSDGTSSLSHMRTNSLVNAMVSASPPSLKSAGETPSGPIALLRLSNCSFHVISATVGGLMSTSHSAFGLSLLNGVADSDQLNCSWKCSDHR